MKSCVGQASWEGTSLHVWQRQSMLLLPHPLGGPRDPGGLAVFGFPLGPLLLSEQWVPPLFSFPSKAQSPVPGQMPRTCLLGTEEPL